MLRDYKLKFMLKVNDSYCLSVNFFNSISWRQHLMISVVVSRITVQKLLPFKQKLWVVSAVTYYCCFILVLFHILYWIHHWRSLHCRVTTTSEANTPSSDDCDCVVNENFNNDDSDDSTQKSRTSKLTQQVNGIMSSSVIGKGVVSGLSTIGLTAVWVKV